MKNKKSTDQWCNLIVILSAIIGFFVICISLVFNLNREYLGVVILLAIVIFIFSKKIFGDNFLDNDVFINYKSNKKILISFIIIFICSLLSIKFSDPYSRSVLYFLSLIILSLIISYQIVFFTNIENDNVVIFEIILLSINIKSSAYFLYPSVSGNDPFYHIEFIKNIIQSSSIPVNSAYSEFPIFHLITSLVSLTGISNIQISYFYISILLTIASLAVYYLGRNLFNYRIGLLSFLVFSISDYTIQWGIQLIPMTFGLILFLFCIMIVFTIKKSEKNNVSWIILLLFFGFTLTLTHTLSTLILLISLLIIWFVSQISGIVLKKEGNYIIKFSLPLILIIFTFIYWGAVNTGSDDFFSSVILRLDYSLNSASIGETSMVSTANSLRSVDVILSEIGWIIMLLLTCIGVLGIITFNYSNISNTLVTFIAFCLVLISTSYISAGLGLKELLPSRWFAFSFIPCSIISSFSLIKIVDSLYLSSLHKPVKTLVFLLYSLVFTSLIFFMITSPLRAAPDSPLYLEWLCNRPGYFKSEIQAMDFAHSTFNSNISGSSKTGRYLKLQSIINPNLPKSYLNNDGIIVREYDLEYGFFIPYTTYQLSDYIKAGNDFFKNIENNYLKIFDNGNTEIYKIIN